MRRFAGLWLVGAIVVLVAIVFGAVYGLLHAMKDSGGAWSEAWRLLFSSPFSLARWLAVTAIVLIVVAGALTPIAWAETRALKAFARREADLRQTRPLDAVTPYEGEDGRGVAFDGPEGRLLLLHPASGFGAPAERFLPREPEFPSPTPSSLPTVE